MTTKKILFSLAVLTLVFSGYAFAESKDVTPINGITVFEAAAYFDAGPLALDRSVGTSRDMVLANGITRDGLWFDIGSVPGSMAESDAYGSAAGGMSSDEPYLDIHNGITDFTGGPQAD